jgi:hypothetical protein
MLAEPMALLTPVFFIHVYSTVHCIHRAFFHYNDTGNQGARDFVLWHFISFLLGIMLSQCLDKGMQHS